MKFDLLAVPAACGLKLLAQSPVIDPGVGALIGNVGIVGILVWHLWYHTTHSYPKMLDKFGLEVEQMRKTFQQEQREAREHDEREKKEQREHAERQANELRAMLIQNLQAMRTAVHDVRD